MKYRMTPDPDGWVMRWKIQYKPWWSLFWITVMHWIDTREQAAYFLEQFRTGTRTVSDGEEP